MRLRSISILLFACVLFVATVAAQTSQQAPPKPETQQVPSGLQQRIQNSKPGTVVTKAEFEKLISALEPNMPTQMRQNVADQLVKIIILAGQGVKENLQTQPRTEDLLRFMRMQVLANVYNQQLQEKAKEVPPDALQKFYDEHQSEYEELTLHRVYIPKNVPPDAKKLTDAELAALATSLDERAKKGEDFDKLQEDAFKAENIKNLPPPTNMGPQRRANFPPSQAATVFALKPGEVSGVITDSMGDFIYKLDSKRVLPLEQVKAEIQRQLQAEQYQNQLGSLFEPVKATLNQQYFGQFASISLPGKPPAPRGNTPPPASQPKPGTPSKP